MKSIWTHNEMTCEKCAKQLWDDESHLLANIESISELKWYLRKSQGPLSNPQD